MSLGEITGRTKSPKGSRPRFPTVHKPNVNLCSGFGSNAFLAMRHTFPRILPMRAPWSNRSSHHYSTLRTEDRLCCWIHATVRGVIRLHDARVFRHGLNAMHHAHDGVACCINRWPNLRTDSRQNGRAIRRTFFGFHDFNVMIVDVRLNLPPKWRTRAASAETNAFHRHLHLAENREGVFEAVSDTLENRANDVGALVRGGKSDKRAARIAVEVRRA